MARLVGAINRWVGTHQEIKPTVGLRDLATDVVLAENDVPVGSIFYEEDTGWEYTYKGAGTWELSPEAGRTRLLLDKLDEMVGVLRDSLLEQTHLNGHLANGSALTRAEALELGRE